MQLDTLSIHSLLLMSPIYLVGVGTFCGQNFCGFCIMYVIVKYFVMIEDKPMPLPMMSIHTDNGEYRNI